MSRQGRTVVVTGGSGSLASALLPRLRRHPGVDRLLALDLRPPRHPVPGVEHRVVDVTAPAVVEHLAGAAAVFHLAFMVMGGSRAPGRARAINVGGTINVAEAAAAAGVEQLIVASSIAAYGAHPENRGALLTEEAPIRGNRSFYYAHTKAEVERWLDGFEARAGSPVVVRLRPSIFLGEVGRSIAPFRRRLFPYLSGADNPVQVTHQDDVADAFVLAFERRAAGAFNLATSDPVPMSRWPHEMGKLGVPVPRGAVLAATEWMQRAGRAGIDPGFIRFGGDYPIVVDAARARRELGWRPRWETTAEVLRRLSGAPAARASRRTRLVFGALEAMSRLFGALPAEGRERELRGFEGAVDLVLRGEHPGAWHLEIGGDGRVRLAAGWAPEARATAILDEATLFDILAGRLDAMTATMTGQLRIRGDAAMSMLVGGFLTRLGSGLRRAPQMPPPLKRWLLRDSRAGARS